MKDDGGNGLAEGLGGFLGILDGLDHVGCEPWCSRGPRRAPVVAIFQWTATCTGTIGGLTWTYVGLHVLHARLVHTALGCREGYSPGSSGGPHVTEGPS